MLCAAHRQLTLLLFFSASVSLSAQQIKLPDTPAILDIAHPSERFPEKWYPRIGDGTDILPAPVLDRPYTAMVSHWTARPASTNGDRRLIEVGTQMRDPLGRTRSEGETGGMTVERKTFKTKTVIVFDPVAHCRFQWTEFVEKAEMPSEDRVAMVNCGPQTLRYQEFDVVAGILEGAVDGTIAHGDTQTRTEHLPPLQVDGLSVQRLRVTNTRTDEHGEARTWVTETWYAPEIREVIRSGSEALGYSGLIDIHRTNPDPKLFYPPETYRIELQRRK